MQTVSLKHSSISGHRIWLGLLLLACGILVFPLASNYFNISPTNESTLYKVAVPAGFLIAALCLRRHDQLQRYWGVAYAFFVASTAVLAVWLAGDWLSPYIVFPPDSALNLFINKVSEASVAVATILVLARLAGWDLGSLYLQRGRLLLGLGLALGFSILLFIPLALMTGLNLNLSAVWMQIGGIAAFAFTNAFMEELWLRGLFLRRFIDLIGPRAAILLTALTFALFHIGATYFSGALLAQFVVTNFLLGLMLAYTIWRSDSLWGAVLLHAVADMLLLVGTFGSGASM